MDNGKGGEMNRKKSARVIAIVAIVIIAAMVITSIAFSVMY